jgi:hypothetical protein
MHDLRHLRGELLAPRRAQAEARPGEVAAHRDEPPRIRAGVGDVLGEDGVQALGGRRVVRRSDQREDVTVGALEIAQQQLAAYEARRAGQEHTTHKRQHSHDDRACLPTGS